MIKLRAFILSLVISAFIVSNAIASSYTNKTDKVVATLTTNREAIQTGEQLYVLIKLQMLNGWHTYWENSGDSGEKTKFSWELPQGYQANVEKFSTPITFVTEDIIQYGYNDTAYFLIKISPSNDSALSKSKYYDYEATISWLACREECVPEKVKIDFSLPVENNPKAISQNWDNELWNANKTFPKTSNLEVFYEVKDGQTFLFNIKRQPDSGIKFSKNMKFLPYNDNLILNEPKQIVGYDGKDTVSLLIEADNPKGDITKGILFVDTDIYEAIPQHRDNLSIYEEYSSDMPFQQDSSLFLVLFMAFVGGLILNLMPCILPILTLKAISLVQSVHNTKESKIEAFMYFFGVVFSFMLVATILVILRINGEKIGWGFQMQSPTFIVIMIIIFFVISLMLLDIITIHNPLHSVGRVSFKQKRINAFMTGLFSVLIASPCTAPFMGVAIGYTLAKPLYIFYPVFLALSIGYALPFTLIGFFPTVMKKFLPKPGKWMLILKKLFALPILLTCLWLLWVLNSQIDFIKTKEETTSDNLQWQTYSEQAVNDSIKKGNAVFIDFTAKWCITCLANKKITLNSKEFAQIVEENNILLYRADWTNYDDNIEKALKNYGRNSIPLYILYPKNNKKYKILPQLITPNILKENI